MRGEAPWPSDRLQDGWQTPASVTRVLVRLDPLRDVLACSPSEGNRITVGAVTGTGQVLKSATSTRFLRGAECPAGGQETGDG